MAAVDPGSQDRARPPAAGEPGAGDQVPDSLPPRERLIAAALDLFGTIGYDATTVQALCQRARISSRDFYLHVADRLELVGILLEREVGEIRAPLSQAFAHAPPVIEARARLWAAHWVRRMVQDPRRFRVVYTEAIGVSADLDRRRQRALHASVELMTQELARCAEARGVRRLPDHYRFVADALLATTREVMARHLDGDLPPTTPERIVDDLVRMAVILGEQW